MLNRTSFLEGSKPFLTNKDCMTNDCITIEKTGDIVTL